MQIVFNIRRQILQERQVDVSEIIVDVASLNASILAEDLEYKNNTEKKAKPDAVSKFPRGIIEVQKALKAAGFNPGSIDGKLGPKTKSAIRRFQKSHDLKVDAKVGRNTWKLLRKYLEE